MSVQRTPRARLLGSACLIVACLLVFSGAASAADGAPGQLYWSTQDGSLDHLSPRPVLVYNGLSGRLMAAEGAAAAALAAGGAVAIPVAQDDVLYAYLLEDASLAAFEPPARILIRSGREVLVAMPAGGGDTPRLTAASDAALRGLKQPVLLSREGIVWPSAEPVEPMPLEGGAREFNPLIQQMVDAHTGANYLATWQALDDFETRYTYASQNVAATDWLLQQFQGFGLEAEFHLYTQNGAQRRNVIATLPGLVDPSRVVYICGHLDAYSGDPYVCAPGADDNGSGTAAVVEAARVLSQYQFEYTIKFACFNGEEQGLVGSDAYAGDMYAAGENILGVYNCDMIAYRGTDPAPPDLIIYTNSASQPIALTLEQSADLYIPGRIDPVVLVEALNASDHASFWARGYKAVCSIEEEAWGPDFCPWYHTCEDRIERYPLDYAVDCSKANLAAVATTAVPIGGSGPYLVLQDRVLDDDEIGGTHGNGDGVPNPGETIDLLVTLRNVGPEPATNVGGTLTTESPYVTLISDAASWQDIPAGGQGTNGTPFRFQVAGDVPDGEPISLTLAMTFDGGGREIVLSFPAAAPRITHWSTTIADQDPGNGNGVPDPGEILGLEVMIANQGAQDADAVEAVLTSSDPRVTIVQGTAGCPGLASGQQALLSPAYEVGLSGDLQPGEVVEFRLDVSAGVGYAAQTGFRIKVGAAFFDEIESEGAWSLVAQGDDATTGRWVRVDPNGTTQDGQPCQTENDHTTAPGTDCFVTGQGSVGGSPSEADVDGGQTTLTTPLLDLSLVDTPRLTYWRWYTNNLGNNPNQDYWVVQVSSNGGTSWVDLERTTQSQNAWVQMSFDVGSYITPSSQVLVRFIASDEGSGSLVEAAVDDVEITGTTQPVAVGDPAPSAVLRLNPVRPNPTASGASIVFALPSAAPARVAVYAVDGRLVRSLLDGPVAAGEHRVIWDGRTTSGREASPGIYFCRLETEGKVLTRRLAIVR